MFVFSPMPLKPKKPSNPNPGSGNNKQKKPSVRLARIRADKIDRNQRKEERVKAFLIESKGLLPPEDDQ